ncbi:DnaJ C-terminal domain-containing protein [Nitrospirillum iridis]|uniref:DnaJ-class molecular chaperone n=1 Tax=Nitrospirillum iridis TaxID=765888 RepID=A0A7X0EGU5_9PROT|nr:DnaJ C-terminal domain-containing protein [Nitrospirillum iridis]MBB6253964.1 DnaJ-class molecular chaperone [Nitrospirillum iridis]
MRDPYQILGVGRSASAEDIKQAYRRLAKQFHPDLNPGRADIELKFKEANGAYSLLSDPDKRARYDRGEIDASGAERPDRSFRRAYAGAGRPGDFDFEDDPFADIFGAARKRTSGVKARGSDVAYSVTVPFTEACLGSKRRLALSTGKSIDINIPPGTQDQQKLRLKGQGLAGLGGAGAGDAIVEVHVTPHPYFVRREDDIHLDVPVTLHEALLGATIKVPTLDGAVQVKVPKTANSGTTLRLKGKGVANPERGTQGDQYVKLTVVLPDRPDAELQAFIEKWAKTHDYDVRRKAGLA